MIAIAKCQIRGSMNMMGDEEAISSLREGVQRPERLRATHR